MIALRNQKLWAVILAIILLAAFFAVLFHHHEHGDHHQDCGVCRLVQQIICFTGLFFVTLLLVKPQGQRFFESSQKLVTFLLTSSLSGRAPPQ